MECEQKWWVLLPSQTLKTHSYFLLRSVSLLPACYSSPQGALEAVCCSRASCIWKMCTNSCRLGKTHASVYRIYIYICFFFPVWMFNLEFQCLNRKWTSTTSAPFIIPTRISWIFLTGIPNYYSVHILIIFSVYLEDNRFVLADSWACSRNLDLVSS